MMLWALTYVEEILFLNDSITHCMFWPVSKKHILDNAFDNFLILSVCVKIPTSFQESSTLSVFLQRSLHST
jgi:hypothetical protein